MNASFLVIVLAKAPLPGLAKTRLIPELGAQGAAELAHRLLDHAVRQALASQAAEVQLCLTPDGPPHPALQPILQAAGPSLLVGEQGPGDLGDRMRRALRLGLERQPRVLLMGTDAPDLDAEWIRLAANALDEHDAVFVPAFDGGYALIGLRQMPPQLMETALDTLFSEMPWSTPSVMYQTRRRLQSIGLRWFETQPVNDIDEPDDLVHLPAQWPR